MSARTYCSNLSFQHCSVQPLLRNEPSLNISSAFSAAKHFPKCWQREWRMYSAAPKTVANVTQMLIYVCKMWARPRKSWHGRRGLQSFATNLFKTLYESRFPASGSISSLDRAGEITISSWWSFGIFEDYLVVLGSPLFLGFLLVWVADAADRTILLTCSLVNGAKSNFWNPGQLDIWKKMLIKTIRAMFLCIGFHWY